VLTVTEAAAAKLKDLMDREGAEGQALRVRVRGGGCSGYEYQLAFDTPQEGDEVIEQRGVKVLVDPKSLLFLAGTEIDFEDGLTGAGFALKNPNAKGSCGCGQSFQA
jgi:iron-sulfur cluster assembly protein